MIDITPAFLFASFVAGLLMFLAPCTLPLVPGYVAFIAGVSEADASRGNARNKILRNALAFVTGFTVVFVTFGLLAGLAGEHVAAYRGWLTSIGGIFIIIFGLVMLDIINIKALNREYHLPRLRFFAPGSPMGAFVIGATFAVGWTPCIGPILASILLLASVSTTAVSGGFMLLVFSIGLAIPFLVTALLFGSMQTYIARYSGVSRWVSRIGGVFLIIIGVLLLTDTFGYTVAYGSIVFEWLQIDGLLDYY